MSFTGLVKKEVFRKATSFGIEAQWLPYYLSSRCHAILKITPWSPRLILGSLSGEHTSHPRKLVRKNLEPTPHRCLIAELKPKTYMPREQAMGQQNAWRCRYHVDPSAWTVSNKPRVSKVSRPDKSMKFQATFRAANMMLTRVEVRKRVWLRSCRRNPAYQRRNVI